MTGCLPDGVSGVCQVATIIPIPFHMEGRFANVTNEGWAWMVENAMRDEPGLSVRRNRVLLAAAAGAKLSLRREGDGGKKPFAGVRRPVRAQRAVRTRCCTRMPQNASAPSGTFLRCINRP